MRTNIVLNDKLIRQAMSLSRTKTKKQVVELALENYIGYLKRHKLKKLFGKIGWEGNLKEMRSV